MININKLFINSIKRQLTRDKMSVDDVLVMTGRIDPDKTYLIGTTNAFLKFYKWRIQGYYDDLSHDDLSKSDIKIDENGIILARKLITKLNHENPMKVFYEDNKYAHLKSLIPNILNIMVKNQGMILPAC